MPVNGGCSLGKLKGTEGLKTPELREREGLGALAARRALPFGGRSGGRPRGRRFAGRAGAFSTIAWKRGSPSARSCAM